MLQITFKNHTIIIGKNENENDKIISNADPEDYWLHLTNFPSPHVIVKNPNKNRINHKILKQAAYQLKINSKFRKIQKLDVTITKIKHIESTNKPGSVILHQIIKTISV